MPGALVDGAEHLLEALEALARLHDLTRRVHERRHRRQRVVDLVAEQPDDTLEHVELLARHLAGDVTHHEQRPRFTPTGDYLASELIALALAVDVEAHHLV